MPELGDLRMNNGQRINISYRIHVLLVDHEYEDRHSIAKKLELLSYKVTCVDFASMGLSLLSSGNSNFDLIIANIDSPDLHLCNLLKQAADVVPVILMSREDSAFMALRALQSGAFLCVTKPVKMEMLAYLWQYVLREKRHPCELKGRLNATKVNMTNRGKLTVEKGESGRNNDENHNKRLKRKTCVAWTQQLHENFLDAVKQLGEGKCFPKEIHNLMKVPGLSRMQVASHLQKCRNQDWVGPKERKSALTRAPPRDKTRKFGAAPFILGNTSSDPLRNQENHEIHREVAVQNDGGHGNQPMEPQPTQEPHYEPFSSSSTPDANVAGSPRNESNDDFANIDDLIYGRNLS